MTNKRLEVYGGSPARHLGLWYTQPVVLESEIGGGEGGERRFLRFQLKRCMHNGYKRQLSHGELKERGPPRDKTNKIRNIENFIGDRCELGISIFLILVNTGP
jgi:hypothetical protein